MEIDTASLRRWIDVRDAQADLLRCVVEASVEPPRAMHATPSDGSAVGIFPVLSTDHLGNTAFGVVDFLCEAWRASSGERSVVVLLGDDSVRLGRFKEKLLACGEALTRLGLRIPTVATLEEISGSRFAPEEFAATLKAYRGNIGSGELEETCLWLAIKPLVPAALYFASNYKPGKLLRDAGIPLLSPIAKAPWRRPVERCPADTKLAPAGACLRGSMRFTLERQNDLRCSCTIHDGDVEVFLEEADRLLVEALGSGPQADEPEVGYQVVEHATRTAARRRSYGVMLFGSPTISLSNIALVALATKLSRANGCAERPLLLIEDVTAALVYRVYEREAVKRLYRAVGARFGVDVAFNSELPRFRLALERWLGTTTIGTALECMPCGKAQRARGQLTVYDAIHLAAMAATWAGYEDYSLVLHARNVATLKGIMAQMPPSYVACHRFGDYGVRLRSAEDFEGKFDERLRAELRCGRWTQLAENLAAVGLATPAAGATPGSVGYRVRRLNVLTTWSLLPEGGGVSMSVRNTIEAIRRHGIDVAVPVSGDVADWASIDRRCALNDHLVLPDADPCLCIDWDGYNVRGLRKGGCNLKIVHVRTNFIDLERYEDGAVGDYCHRMAAYMLRNIETADGIVVSSAYTLSRIRSFLPPDVQVRVIANGLDGLLIEKLGQLSSREPEHRTVLALGSFHRRKSFDTLIRASLYLHEQGMAHKLLLAGDGPERPRLTSMAAGFPHIELLPFVKTSDELAALYCRASIVCHPALQEDFGNVYLEAGAAGRPIVAARAGAAPELVHDAKTGLLFNPGSWRSLATRLICLFATEKTRRKLGARGRERAAAYSWSKSAASIVSFIDATYYLRHGAVS